MTSSECAVKSLHIKCTSKTSAASGAWQSGKHWMALCPFLHSIGGLDLPVVCYSRVQRRQSFSDFRPTPPSLMLKGMENLVNSSFKVMNSESMATCMHLLKWHGGGHLQIAGIQGKSCLLVETQRKLVSWIVTEKYKLQVEWEMERRELYPSLPLSWS